ncbi:response regulator [Ilyomonas limi]|uniref:Response regulator n=1 Tax=Ilyomonas limi TaxID=2575867 RepID=A0A4U3L7U9_9BACT|nr:response regulator [Ilyomonas limi]TKK69936.1 response regulator [Ilyomonas limi]
MNIHYCTGHFTLYVKEAPANTYTGKPAKPLLIVDDSPLIVKKISEWLEEVEGITSIESCGTYARAVDLLAVCKPAVVLLDVNLPDKSGIVLLKHIKALYPGTTVIMVTNQGDDFYKNLCLESGAHYFLDKSNDFEKLPALVASIIQ